MTTKFGTKLKLDKTSSPKICTYYKAEISNWTEIALNRLKQSGKRILIPYKMSRKFRIELKLSEMD